MFSRCRVVRLVVLVSLAGLLQACDVDLYTNLEQREANAMVAVLLREGIAASRKLQDNGQLTVVVDEKRFAEAVTALEDAGLPEQAFSNMGQIFKSNGLVSSPTQERAQMVYALSEELSHSLSQIDGILSARVHVVLPENDLLKRVISPSSASVLVRYDPATDIDRLIPQIKTLVANGISGLTYEGVSITAIKATLSKDDRASAAPRLGRFLGIWVQESDMAQIRLMFGLLLACTLGLAGAFGWRHWQRHRARRVYTLEDAA